MKFLYPLITVLLLFSCQTKEELWRYEVRGYVNYKGQPHDAIWYTDTIEIHQDFATYTNSDGSEVIIKPPFKLIDHKLCKTTEHN